MIFERPAFPQRLTLHGCLAAFPARLKSALLKQQAVGTLTSRSFAGWWGQALMRVAVVGAAGGASGHLFNGDYAALELAAADVLELNGGMADVKVVLEHVVELEEDAGALDRKST